MNVPASTVGVLGGANRFAWQEDDDALYARNLQDAEHRRAREADARSFRTQIAAATQASLEEKKWQTDVRLSDPVWGDVHSSGDRFDNMQLVCWTCCPCALVGCGGSKRCCGRGLAHMAFADARRAWWRFLCSASALLSTAQVTMFFCSVAVGGGFAEIEVNPMLGAHAHTLNMLGAKNAARILYFGEWWRLVSPMFLHGGLIHIGMNLSVQLHVGVRLEVLWGHSAWICIYVVSGVYSNLISCTLLPNSLSVGSSGALCGLIGAWVMFSLFTWRQTLPRDIVERNITFVSLIINVVAIALVSFFPMVDFASHAGGLLAGSLMGACFFAGRLQDRAVRTCAIATSITATALVGFGSTAFFVFHVEPSRGLLDLCSPSEC